MKERLATIVCVTLLVVGFGMMTWRGFRELGDVMGDRGFYRFDNEHELIHGYDRRETKRLTLLGAGVIAYAQHNKGVLPAFTSSMVLTQQLSPRYVTKPETFIDPNSHRPFAVNQALSGVRLRSVVKPADCVVFYQIEAPARYRFIMYVTLDGVVHTDPETVFAHRVAMASNSS